MRLSVVDDNEMPGSKPKEKLQKHKGRLRPNSMQEGGSRPTELGVFEGSQLSEVFGGM